MREKSHLWEEEKGKKREKHLVNAFCHATISFFSGKKKRRERREGKKGVRSSRARGQR